MDTTDPCLGQSEESKDGRRQENGVRIGWVSQCSLPGGGSILGKVSRRGIILGQEEVHSKVQVPSRSHEFPSQSYSHLTHPPSPQVRAGREVPNRRENADGFPVAL